MEYHTLTELLIDVHKKYPHHVAYSSMGRKLTYSELFTQASHFKSFLKSELEIGAQEKIAIMLPNCLQHPIAVHGSLMARLCVVNVNPLYTADELNHQLKDSQATAILVLENMAHIVEKALDGTNVKHIIITKIGDMHGRIKGNLLNFVVKHIKKMVPNYHLTHIPFQSTLKTPITSLENDILPSDLAFLQYTGGTTGLSKGAMLTHQNI